MSKLKILLVDDEPDILNVLRLHLSNFGYEIRTALNGSEAIRQIQHSDPPNVVFLDYVLPQYDGMQLLRLMKQQVPSIVVVMMSGKATEDVARECLSYGAFDYIQKPFTLERVTDVMQAVILFSDGLGLLE
ncbi:MAG: response regulator [Candidatus Electryoneaceae bacterium]|nr:response regulator [Candidatus Electryoneaceae bacterium]